MATDRLNGNKTPFSMLVVFWSVRALPAIHEPAKLTGPLAAMPHLLGGMTSLLSSVYIAQQSWSCFKLLMHCRAWALVLALLKAGNSIAAKMAMMAITTSNSKSVKPLNLPARLPARSTRAWRFLVILQDSVLGITLIVRTKRGRSDRFR